MPKPSRIRTLLYAEVAGTTATAPRDASISDSRWGGSQQDFVRPIYDRYKTMCR